MEHEVSVKGRFTEALVLFVGIPMLFYWELVPLPKILGLLVVGGYCGFQLWRDPDFGFSLLLSKQQKEAGKGIAFRLPVVVIVLTALVLLFNPNQWLAFPAERPLLWLVVMVLYPVLSALPQEFIFRTYFFHRYERCIHYKYGTIILSALAFSFLHIVYDNWWAIALSFVAGLLFGITYSRTRSLFWVTVEHALYGCLVFTLGLGHYFYEAF